MFCYLLKFPGDSAVIIPNKLTKDIEIKNVILDE